MNVKTLKIHITNSHPNNKRLDLSEVRVGTLPVSVLGKITPIFKVIYICLWYVQSLQKVESSTQQPLK